MSREKETDREEIKKKKISFSENYSKRKVDDFSLLKEAILSRYQRVAT